MGDRQIWRYTRIMPCISAHLWWITNFVENFFIFTFQPPLHFSTIFFYKMFLYTHLNSAILPKIPITTKNKQVAHIGFQIVFRNVKYPKYSIHQINGGNQLHNIFRASPDFDDGGGQPRMELVEVSFGSSDNSKRQTRTHTHRRMDTHIFIYICYRYAGDDNTFTFSKQQIFWPELFTWAHGPCT